MTMTEIPTLEEVRQMRAKLQSSGKKPKEDLAVWEQACRAFLETNPSVDEKEQLLTCSVIYCGIAAGSIHADCFTECQKQVVQHYESMIDGCQTVGEIKQIVDKISSVISSAVHITPGQPAEAFMAREKAARKWFHLCKTRDELVELIEGAHVDIEHILDTRFH
jgi:hypothetical protein